MKVREESYSAAEKCSPAERTLERDPEHGSAVSLKTRDSPIGLSFLSLPRSFGTYPDTGESGETYDKEVSFFAKRNRLPAPIGEYSE